LAAAVLGQVAATFCPDDGQQDFSSVEDCPHTRATHNAETTNTPINALDFIALSFQIQIHFKSLASTSAALSFS
jgi:hypothetical protein